MRKLLLVAVLAGGCGRAPIQTAADACYLYSGTVCARFVQCGQSVGSVATCRDNSTQGCCAKNDCARAIKDEQFVYDCDDALRAMTCAQVITGLVPNICLGK